MDGKTPKPHSQTKSGLRQPSQWTDNEQKAWVPLLFVGCVLLYAVRGALPVTVIQMSVEFEWDKRTSGAILSSFFWGYMMTQIIGGQLADKHGGEVVIWMSGIGWSLAILSITLFASISNVLVAISNFINGICQAVFFPATISIMSSRVIDNQRSFMYGMIGSGVNIGSAISGLLGYIFLVNIGWEFMFLAIGLSSLSWALSIRWLSRKHEKKMHYRLLDNDSKEHATINVNIEKSEPTCVDVPWRLLLKQPPVFAVIYSFFGQGFFLHNLMAWAPTYFHETFPEMQHMAWLYNVTPWIAKAISSFVSGWTAKQMIENGFSTTTTRKCMEGTSHLGSIITLLILSWIGSDQDYFYSSLITMNLAFFVNGFETAGSAINPTDLVPSYSGVLYGMMNTGCSIAGIIGVSFIGHILHTTGNWSLVFITIACVCFSALIVYMCFGSGKRLVHIDS